MKYTFKVEDDNRTLELKIDPVQATDLVREIYYFLVGASFHKNTVLDAFETIVEEYKDLPDNE